MGLVVYKVSPRLAWEQAARSRQFEGSDNDHRDGFIHLSSAAQVPGTLVKHFAGQPDLLLVAIDAEALGAALRWEPSASGTLYPHLYGPLPIDAVLEVTALPITARGRHVLPEGFAQC